VQRAVGGGDAFLAEQAFQRLPQRPGDDEVRAQRQGSGEGRGGDRVHRLRAELQPYDVAVVAQPGHERQRVTGQPPAVAEGRDTPAGEGRLTQFQHIGDFGDFAGLGGFGLDRLDGHFSPAASLLTYGGVDRSSQLSTVYRPDSWWNQ
jgi:hypothetical protein